MHFRVVDRFTFGRFSLSKTFLNASTLLSLGLLTACVGEPDSTETVEESFPFTEMMANYADNIIIPSHQDFLQKSQALSEGTELQAYCDAIGTADEAEKREEVQALWLDMMQSWQANELLILGPLAANGNSLRNSIYSYASTFSPSSCAVDQSVVAATEENFSIEGRRLSSRGLDALEYLFFNDDINHSCPDTTQRTQGWNDLSEVERKTQRCEYAQLAAKDVTRQAQTLVTAWDVEGGNYRAEFINPDNLSTNLEALSDALFYIEELTKDTKLGLPTGLKSECREVACPEEVEFPYSMTSFASIEYNLRMFETLLMGGDGLGFDDLIAAKDMEEITAEFLVYLNTAYQFIDNIDTPLIEQSTLLLDSGDDSECINSSANPNPDANQGISMCSLHGFIKPITDQLRIDFIAAVNLDLPERSQSDND